MPFSLQQRLLILIFCTMIPIVAKGANRPNLVVILADDFGVGDIQAHFPNNKIKTPWLDRMVNRGMSFTDAHSPSSVCTPTRYGLLTGRYSWRTRLQEWVLGCYEPPLIASDQLTLPALLGEVGYQTACIGKWHLGWNWPGSQASQMVEPRNALARLSWDYSKPIQDGPTQRGFDYYFGTHVPNFPPFTFIENDRVVTPPNARYLFEPGQGVVMPKSFSGLPMAPGWRFDRILPEITKRAVRYIHEQSTRDRPFFLFFSMTSPHEPVVPSREFSGKSGIAPIADFVMETDWSAGQIIKAVEDAGVAENTLIMFTSDNGHSHYTGWDKLMDAGHFPSGPFRGHKGDIWEGGHRVPFIVSWPGKVKAGQSSDVLLCLNDIFATFTEIVGAPFPDNAAVDSFSFLPALVGNQVSPLREHVVSHSVYGEFAYREGPWKVVYKRASRDLENARGKPVQVELYRLDVDPAETNNLAKQERLRVTDLGKGLETIIQRGRSRPGRPQSNDTRVRFDVIQSQRWTASLSDSED
jgi:arylsulfatase A-like enzyme